MNEEALFRTNPIWCLRKCLTAWLREPLGALHAPDRLAGRLAVLRQQGIALSSSSLRDLARQAGLLEPPQGPEPQPGVVGLVVDEREEGAERGFVTPLRARRGRWHVPYYFPFREFHLQTLLLRLIYASTLSRDGAIPEHLAFTLSDGLGERSRGESMHVAGLLAILDEVAGGPPLLRRCCAVVEPYDDQLRPVGLVREKLNAFRRECGAGTLLVYHPDSAGEVAEYEFTHRWPVESLADLARWAQGRGGTPDLLSPLLADVTLGPEDVEAAYRFVREQMDRHHRFAPALDLSRRLLKCKKRPDVPAPLWRNVQRAARDLSRHLGYLEESECVAREQAQLLKQADAVTSYDEQAEADVLLAAVLYHLHRFQEMVDLLSRWEKHIARNELAFSPETRVKVFNTQARALTALGPEGWEERIERSLGILASRDPADRCRSWCYLAHGRLRWGNLSGARQALAAASDCAGAPLYSHWMRAFLLADLARRSGDALYQDDRMEAAGDSTEFGLPLASYLQATARHPACCDRQDRFHRAAEVLRRDVGPFNAGNLLHGLAALMDLAAASTRSEWQAARARLAPFLGPDSRLGLYAYYREAFDALPDEPEVWAVERLLDRVPHF